MLEILWTFIESYICTIFYIIVSVINQVELIWTIHHKPGDASCDNPVKSNINNSVIQTWWSCSHVSLWRKMVAPTWNNGVVHILLYKEKMGTNKEHHLYIFKPFHCLYKCFERIITVIFYFSEAVHLQVRC